MTTSRPPRRARPAGATAMSAPTCVRHQREVVAQVGDVGPRDVELDGRHRVARQPADAVDVGAVVGDRGGDGGDVVRLEGGAHDDDGGPAGAARGVVTAAHLEVDPHPESPRRPG